MADDAEIISFTVGVTDLHALAEARGYQYVLSEDQREEFVVRADGTIVIRAFRAAPHRRIPRQKDPTVWLRSIRYHTYLGVPQHEGSVYLAHDEQVENILTQKFAVLDTPPPKAVRPA
jgi:hypothetical protein